LTTRDLVLLAVAAGRESAIALVAPKTPLVSWVDFTEGIGLQKFPRLTRATWANFCERFAVAGSQVQPDKLRQRWVSGSLVPEGSGRRDEDVTGWTMLVLDADKGGQPRVLREALTKLGLAYCIHESYSSRFAGAGIRWHCLLPLAQPGPDIVDKDELRLEYAYLSGAFAELGNLPAFDQAMSERLLQLVYLGNKPTPEAPDRAIVWAGGKVLDWSATLRVLGYSAWRSKMIMLGAGVGSVGGKSNVTVGLQAVTKTSLTQAIATCTIPLAQRIQRAVKYLDRIDASISGQGGSLTAMRAVAHTMAGFLIPPEMVAQVLNMGWNQRCLGLDGEKYPWSDWELRHKIESVDLGRLPGLPGWHLNLELQKVRKDG